MKYNLSKKKKNSISFFSNVKLDCDLERSVREKKKRSKNSVGSERNRYIIKTFFFPFFISDNGRNREEVRLVYNTCYVGNLDKPICSDFEFNFILLAPPSDF